MYKKKSLGQNFLKDKNILNKIVEGAKVSDEDTILEVGPGEGTLTEVLLQKARKVITIEKDDRLIPILNEKFTKEISSGKLELVHGDVLEFSISNFQFPKNHYKIVANIPYYITGQIIRKFLENQNPPSLMTLLVQKEVAERIVAKDGKESILSMSVKAYGNPIYIDTVKAGSFTPAPSVDSAIITIEDISKDFFKNTTEANLFEILKKGFSSKRKMLTGNLGIKGEILSKCGIKEKARAENLSIEDWRKLTNYLSPQD